MTATKSCSNLAWVCFIWAGIKRPLLATACHVRPQTSQAYASTPALQYSRPWAPAMLTAPECAITVRRSKLNPNRGPRADQICGNLGGRPHKGHSMPQNSPTRIVPWAAFEASSKPSTNNPKTATPNPQNRDHCMIAAWSWLCCWALLHADAQLGAQISRQHHSS